MVMLNLFKSVGFRDSEDISSKIARKLRDRANVDWLIPGCVEKEIRLYCADHRIRLGRYKIRRLETQLSGKVSKFLIKRIADQNDIKLIGSRCELPNHFIVHEFMNPWFLMEDHAGHLRHPRKNWEFWYSRPHREWVENIREINALVPDMPDQFQTTFSDWIDESLVKEVRLLDGAIQGSLYEVCNET